MVIEFLGIGIEDATGRMSCNVVTPWSVQAQDVQAELAFGEWT